MRHVSTITKGGPAKAAVWPETHPALWDAVSAFVKDPVGTIELHVKGAEEA